MFTSLYVKTNYSLLSSLVSIDNLILYAVEHKLSALAICDDNMTSTKIFYDKCIKNFTDERRLLLNKPRTPVTLFLDKFGK